MHIKAAVIIFITIQIDIAFTARKKTIRQANDYGYSEGPIKNGYSSGSGLRSIAQGSADQAHSIVTTQHLAANQAAYVAKNTLAQAAQQAAQVAQAALAGKQVLLQGLEQQSLEAHQALESEIKQMQQAKRAAKSAQLAAQQAMNHVNVLQAALNNAQTASEHAQISANEASAEFASQTAMVGSAQKKVEEIEEQLTRARVDFEATRDATENAQKSATIAQNVAAEAAAQAASSAHDQVKHQIETNSDVSFGESGESDQQLNDGSSAFSESVPVYSTSENDQRHNKNKSNRVEYSNVPTFSKHVKNHNYRNHKTDDNFPYAGY